MKARLYSCAITDTEAGGVSCYDKFKKPDGTWDWPKNPGFSEPPSKKILPAGTNLDRYGDPSGSFLPPKGTPYEQRALAPGSRSGGYHEYEVVKPPPVIQGEIAPAFWQSCGGTQIPPNFSNRVNNKWFIDNEYIRRTKQQ